MGSVALKSSVKILFGKQIYNFLYLIGSLLEDIDP